LTAFGENIRIKDLINKCEDKEALDGIYREISEFKKLFPKEMQLQVSQEISFTSKTKELY